MDAYKRFNKHEKVKAAIKKRNDKNPFTKIWNQMNTEERAVYMGILKGNIELPAELVGNDKDPYEILKRFEFKMIEKYGESVDKL